MFINYTNHSSSTWSAEQTQAAEAFGAIKDIPFPSVPADADEEAIEQMAQAATDEIMSWKPNAVLCQGEHTLCFCVARKLSMKGITVLAACSDRKCIEERLPDGTNRRTSEFCFVRFRRYIG